MCPEWEEKQQGSREGGMQWWALKYPLFDLIWAHMSALFKAKVEKVQEKPLEVSYSNVEFSLPQFWMQNQLIFLELYCVCLALCSSLWYLQTGMCTPVAHREGNTSTEERLTVAHSPVSQQASWGQGPKSRCSHASGCLEQPYQFIACFQWSMLLLCQLWMCTLSVTLHFPIVS